MGTLKLELSVLHSEMTMSLQGQKEVGYGLRLKRFGVRLVRHRIVMVNISC